MTWKYILKDEPEPEREGFKPIKFRFGPSIDKLKRYARTIHFWREWVQDKKGRGVRKNNTVREHLLTEPLAKKALEVLDRVTFTHDQKGKEGNVVEMFGEYIITARWSSYPASHPVYGKVDYGNLKQGSCFYLGLTVIRTFPGREPHAVRLEMEMPRAKELDEFSDEEIDSYSWMVDWRESSK